MNLPHDLKAYRADDLGAFQILTPDQCVFGICILAAYAMIFLPYL